ncbi:MAG: hypothetical protein KDI47_16610, partial [Gammaproteobacteria bacterium]|nr:hypothetical protein [Gammaproteobacteria bacterium]
TAENPAAIFEAVEQHFAKYRGGLGHCSGHLFNICSQSTRLKIEGCEMTACSNSGILQGGNAYSPL